MLLLFFRASIWPRRRKSFHQKLYSRLSAGSILKMAPICVDQDELQQQDEFLVLYQESGATSSVTNSPGACVSLWV